MVKLFKILLFLLLVPQVLFATDRYVHNTSSTNSLDCTNGISTYNPTGDSGDGSCTGGSDYVYSSIQNSITAMSAGDTIYIRGGTYTEDSSGGNVNLPAIEIPNTKNGSAWTEGNYNTLTSYPGEWAIIDGEGDIASGAVIGKIAFSRGGTTELAYWKFERLGITGGGGAGEKGAPAGLFLTAGPHIVRYCHIYDNWNANNYNNPTGLNGTRMRDSVVEYNYFYHNGSAGNNGEHIYLNPYPYCAESDGADGYCDNPLDTVARNEIRYNRIAGSNGSTITEHPIKYKVSTIFTDIDGSGPDTREDWGDKIHHNIFTGTGSSLILKQDYLQLYQNIFDAVHVTNGDYNYYHRLFITIYNNTFAGGAVYSQRQPNNGTFTAAEHIINNVFDLSDTVDIAGQESDGVDYATVCSSSETGVFYSDWYITNNYSYRPVTTTHYQIAIAITGALYGNFTAEALDIAWTNHTGNVSKATSEGSDNLYEVDGLTTRGAHSTGSTTIANGGTGGNHPYLSGVTIPEFLGATNPDDNSWVAGVNSLDVTYFTNEEAGSTPSWVEGAATTGVTIDPTANQVTCGGSGSVTIGG